ECATGALADAGLTKHDVDGYLCGSDAPGGALAMADYLNLRVKFIDSTNVGGSSYILHVAHAAQAIAAGKCNTVLITLAGRPRSEPAPALEETKPDVPWEKSIGARLLDLYAMCAQRHMHEFGTTSEQLAWI